MNGIGQQENVRGRCLTHFPPLSRYTPDGIFSQSSIVGTVGALTAKCLDSSAAVVCDAGAPAAKHFDVPEIGSGTSLPLPPARTTVLFDKFKISSTSLLVTFNSLVDLADERARSWASNTPMYRFLLLPR